MHTPPNQITYAAATPITIYRGPGATQDLYNTTYSLLQQLVNTQRWHPETRALGGSCYANCLPLNSSPGSNDGGTRASISDSSMSSPVSIFRSLKDVSAPFSWDFSPPPKGTRGSSSTSLTAALRAPLLESLLSRKRARSCCPLSDAETKDIVWNKEDAHAKSGLKYVRNGLRS